MISHDVVSACSQIRSAGCSVRAGAAVAASASNQISLFKLGSDNNYKPKLVNSRNNGTRKSVAGGGCKRASARACALAQTHLLPGAARLHCTFISSFPTTRFSLVE